VYCFTKILRCQVSISNDRNTYRRFKEEYAMVVQKAVEDVYPLSKGKIEVTDVTTPMTTLHITGNWQAAYEGWTPTIKNLKTRVPKTLPRLKNFRMAGQWTEPGGGIPTAVRSGRDAVYMISKNDKLNKSFSKHCFSICSFVKFLFSR